MIVLSMCVVTDISKCAVCALPLGTNDARCWCNMSDSCTNLI